MVFQPIVKIWIFKVLYVIYFEMTTQILINLNQYYLELEAINENPVSVNACCRLSFYETWIVYLNAKLKFTRKIISILAHICHKK